MERHPEVKTVQIEPTRLNHIAAANVTKPGSTPATASAGGAEAAGATEGLQLSQQASEVRAAHEALAALPETRADLVAELKAQIQAGTYAVDPETIAEKLIP